MSKNKKELIIKIIGLMISCALFNFLYWVTNPNGGHPWLVDVAFVFVMIKVYDEYDKRNEKKDKEED